MGQLTISVDSVTWSDHCVDTWQCDDMSRMCDRIITELKDPLVIQPAALELATIRKKPEDELVSDHT